MPAHSPQSRMASLMASFSVASPPSQARTCPQYIHPKDIERLPRHPAPYKSHTPSLAERRPSPSRRRAARPVSAMILVLPSRFASKPGRRLVDLVRALWANSLF